MRRALVLVLALSLSPALPAARASQEPVHLIGALHEHSGYSDGWPGSTPQNYFASAKSFGLDFLGSGEHSDSARLPTVFSEECLTPAVASCAIADPTTPVNSFRKWDATLEYGRAASDVGGFTGFRGFEWTSDVFGHINVYLSRNDANAKADGGYGATMETFWQWLRTPADLGGGADGIATFNHPGDKCSLGKTDPTCDWNGFTFVPDADGRMVGIELYNGTKDYGSGYVRALNQGWHVGAVGAEDKGHDRPDQWGSPSYAKTVLIDAGPCYPFEAPCPDGPPSDLTVGERRIQRIMAARRMYAVLDNAIRIEMEADGEYMGSRLQRGVGETFSITASVTGSGASLDLISNTGVVAHAEGASIGYVGAGTNSERYYFLRVNDAAGKPVAYSSPVWVRP